MIISQLKKYLLNGIKYIKRGGVTYVTVTSVEHGFSLSNKIAIIIGGSQGIGYAIAKKFISEGANVTITGRNLDHLLTAQENLGSRCSICQWDCSDLDKLDSVLESIFIQRKENYHPSYILVNCAGLYIHKDFSSITVEDWDKVFNINLKALYFISQRASSYLMERSGGKIINIASNRGLMGDYGPYGLAKAGVINLTQGLALELIPHNIIVNAIAPGITATNINHIDPFSNAFLDFVPNRRICLPEEIAEIAALLASDAANNIVGQVITCDGGDSIKAHR